MRTDRIFGAAAFVLAAICSSSAGAQTGSASEPPPGDGVIHLHLPGSQTGGRTIHLHPIRRHGAAPAASPDADVTATPLAPEAPAPAAPAHGRTSRRTNASGKAAIPFNFGEDVAPPPTDIGAAPPAAPPSLKTASLPPHAGAPTRASVSGNEHAGLTKRGAVMFEKGATDPSPAQFSGVKLLAGDLTTALESGASRIQLEAYGGAPGDKSSDARRLSLKRALAVRQLLIDNGVPSNRIDVRAMGGVDDKGPTDRVDVFVRAG